MMFLYDFLFLQIAVRSHASRSGLRPSGLPNQAGAAEFQIQACLSVVKTHISHLVVFLDIF
jgi:hypothetical protein